MYFDGVMNVCGNGARAIIISPNDRQISYLNHITIWLH
jgi:hypothetical protein